MTAHKKFNILLIEDDMELSLMQGRFLMEEGYNVVIAITGSMALEIVERQMVDLVILDLGLPDMRGENLLSKIKRIRPNVKIIIMTGHEGIESYISTMQRGAMDYLIKPVSPKSLLSVLKRVLI